MEKDKLLLEKAFQRERTKILADFAMELKVKDSLIAKLDKKGESNRDALQKLIKMIEHPRLV